MKTDSNRGWAAEFESFWPASGALSIKNEINDRREPVSLSGQAVNFKSGCREKFFLRTSATQRVKITTGVNVASQLREIPLTEKPQTRERVSSCGSVRASLRVFR